MEYYYTDFEDQTRGPVSAGELRFLAAKGEINASTMIAAVGSREWSPVGTVLPALAHGASRETEPLAIASIVLCLFGFACLGPLASVPAVICGHLALSRLQQNPSMQGKGLAMTGLVIGYVQTAIAIGLIIYFVLLDQGKLLK